MSDIIFERAAANNRAILADLRLPGQSERRCPLIDRPDCGEHSLGPCPYAEQCEKPETLEQTAHVGNVPLMLRSLPNVPRHHTNERVERAARIYCSNGDSEGRRRYGHQAGQF